MPRRHTSSELPEDQVADTRADDAAGLPRHAVQLARARKAAGLTQQELAERAGVARMTVQRLEAGDIDPRLSTLGELMRVLGLELVLVPAMAREEVESFVRAGGRWMAQPPGVAAPLSIVDALGSDRNSRSL